MALYKDEKLANFMKKNLKLKIFELGYVLKQSGDRLLFNNLISKLNRTKNDDNLVFEQLLDEWYEKIFEKIIRNVYSDSLHEPLIIFQKKHYWDYTVKSMNITRVN